MKVVLSVLTFSRQRKLGYDFGHEHIEPHPQFPAH